jgi:hypothetical protein
VQDDTDLVDYFPPSQLITLLPEEDGLPFFLLELEQVSSALDHLISLKGVVLVVGVVHVVLVLIPAEVVLFLQEEGRDAVVHGLHDQFLLCCHRRCDFNSFLDGGRAVGALVAEVREVFLVQGNGVRG